MQPHTAVASEENKGAEEWAERYKEASTQQIKNRTGAENSTKRETAGERQRKENEQTKKRLNCRQNTLSKEEIKNFLKNLAFDQGFMC